MGNRRRNSSKRPSKNKGPRANESRVTKSTTTNVTEIATSAPEGSELWDGVTPKDLRELINKHGHWGLRFPAKVVAGLLDEIERLEGQA